MEKRENTGAPSAVGACPQTGGGPGKVQRIAVLRRTNMATGTFWKASSGIREATQEIERTF